MMARNQSLTEDDKILITELYKQGIQQKVIAQQVNSTVSIVSHYLKSSGLKALSRIWPDSDINFIKSSYKDKTVEEIAQFLNRSTHAIYQKLFELGLRAERRKSISHRAMSKHLMCKNIIKRDPFREKLNISGRRIKSDELVQKVIKKRAGQNLVNERYIIRDINDAFGGGIQKPILNKAIRQIRSLVKTKPISSRSVAYDFSQVAS